jgi:hypothetical protein
MNSNRIVAMGLVTFGGIMASVPLLIKKTAPPIDTNEKALTGTQRMRGLYFNYGSSDAGPDPNWDPVTKTWNGWRDKDEDGTTKQRRRKKSEKEHKR